MSPHQREQLERAEDTPYTHSSNNSNSHNFYLSTQISQIDHWDRPRIGSFALLPLENPLVLLVAARGGKPRYLPFPDSFVQLVNFAEGAWGFIAVN